jgi:hypothetical protein
MVDVWQLLRGEVNVGASVLVADWRCDWIGMGVAEKLARDGCRVRLAINGYVPGQRIQQYVRDQWNGTLHKLGVEVIPYARLYGADGDTVYLQHIASGEPILCEGVDTVVLALGHEQESELADSLADWPGELHRIGDCVAPRTGEEAVLEGLKVGSRSGALPVNTGIWRGSPLVAVRGTASAGSAVTSLPSRGGSKGRLMAGTSRSSSVYTQIRNRKASERRDLSFTSWSANSSTRRINSQDALAPS